MVREKAIPEKDRSMGAKARVNSFRKLLAHLRDELGLDMGFRLWDGSLEPEGWPENAFTIRITDEGKAYEHLQFFRTNAAEQTPPAQLPDAFTLDAMGRRRSSRSRSHAAPAAATTSH